MDTYHFLVWTHSPTHFVCKHRCVSAILYGHSAYNSPFCMDIYHFLGWTHSFPCLVQTSVHLRHFVWSLALSNTHSVWTCITSLCGHTHLPTLYANIGPSLCHFVWTLTLKTTFLYGHVSLPCMDTLPYPLRM